MKKHFVPLSFAILFSIVLYSCKTGKQISETKSNDDLTNKSIKAERGIYHGSSTVSFNLIHTKLEVVPLWEKQQLAGTAELTLKPHFYPASKLYLNARGMEINEVKLVTGDQKSELGYEYKNDSIRITLDKTYHSVDTLKIYIDYVAKPEELETEGSAAITNDKGLYFINADGADPSKPVQLWTQGETQSNSVWFPTIDQPNQKSTQELYITVDTSFTTLSNGLKISSIINATNGTRTDYWRQMIPHAPYLFMMAIGKYAIVKDEWNKKEVSYYVEPPYEKFARLSFGNTPEMLTFYSNLLGVEYAWDKYSQVVVRDYVSGAMENTTAVIFGEFMNQDDREMLDRTYEDVIAHEVFHHWFGDLVTMESWANIPLNESFATYGEYLWFEYKYGRQQADYTGQEDLNTYMREARAKQVDLIRYDYKKREDMFDSHSYAKGGRVLHMLRKYVGDDAFFPALKLYLNRHRHKTTEIHDLRLAFEEITGEDLNWFFNQWFLDKGHPSLKIDYEFASDNSVQKIHIQQLQNLETTPLYRLPVNVDLYYGNHKETVKIDITKQNQTFEITVSSKPQLVNFDSEKMLLCTKTDNHSDEEWVTMYQKAPLYLDRYEAVSRLSKNYGPASPQGETMKKALDDIHWNIRILAIRNSSELIKADPQSMKQKLVSIAQNDSKAAVRDAALLKLSEAFPTESGIMEIMYKATKDSSYEVMQTALTHILETDKEKGLAELSKMQNDSNNNISEIVSGFYTFYGTDKEFDFMTSSLDNSHGYDQYSKVIQYAKYLLLCSPATASRGIDKLSAIGKDNKIWFVRFSAVQALSELARNYGKKTNIVEDSVAEPVRSKASGQLEIIKQKETDPNLVKIYMKN